MDTFNPLDHPICFQVPDRLQVVSAWYEHVPFAFYLTEVAQPKCLVELGTHNGVSFLAFCQAVQTLSLDTKTFAIDTWEGDEMAGYYGQEVFDELRAYHDSRYAKFSSLLRMTFDKGVDYFSDGSIDLLHIDGLHTYEAVKHDFENWYKKLTPNAIVIFHDTNVHENDFGVWRYWEELKQKYTSFEFFHGHGLGVLTLADNFPQGLRVDKNGITLNKFRNFFAVLGQKHLYENTLTNLKHEIEFLHSHIDVVTNTSNSDKANAEQTIQKLEMELAEEKANAEQTIQKLEMALAEEKANAEQTIQKLEMALAEEKANAEQTIQKLEIEFAEEKADAEQVIEKLEKTVITEQTNAKLRIQDLEKKINGLIWEIAQKDSAYAAEKKALSEENHRLEQEKVLLADQKAELEKALAFAKKEIVDYYTSTSWNMTRPFRWLTKQLRGRNA